MFVTTQLNVLTQVLCEHGCSENVIEQLNQRFVNLEATLLRAKVLREFFKKEKYSDYPICNYFKSFKSGLFVFTVYFGEFKSNSALLNASDCTSSRYFKTLLSG